MTSKMKIVWNTFREENQTKEKTARIMVSNALNKMTWQNNSSLFFNLLNTSDDPYYSGLRARVPNFAKVNTKTNGTINDKKTSFFGKKEGKSKDKEKDLKDKEVVLPKQRPSYAQMPHPASFSTLYQLHQMQNGMLGTVSRKANYQRHKSQPESYNMWHAKSYESGIGKNDNIAFNFVLI